MAEPRIRLVLDTPVLRAYVAGTHGVGRLLARLADREHRALVPGLCLADAYRTATAEDALVLDVLHNLDQTIVTPVLPDDCAILGGWTTRLDRIDLAHAVLECASRHLPIMTADRDLVTQVLPKQWPIIDL